SFTPVFIGNKEQLYTIELRTKAGCVTVDTQIVKINKTIEIYVPNIFTPNDDGKNDFLRPFMIGIKQLNYFKIYNRWGQLVYETHDAIKGWDGKYKSRPAEMQTVVWLLEGLGVDNKIYTAKGSTVLLR
ncbi:MAG: gliding motility-associated C-terminal domain-containing protein, partial [Ferruginibacter sp.]